MHEQNSEVSSIFALRPVTEAPVVSSPASVPKPPSNDTKPLLLGYEQLKRLKDEHRGAEWIVEDLIERDSLVLFAGDSGLGKIRIAHRRALGMLYLRRGSRRSFWRCPQPAVYPWREC